MMRTFRIYSLKNFQICHTAVLSLVIMLRCISPVLVYLITGGLYLLTIFVQFSHSYLHLLPVLDYYTYSRLWWHLNFFLV